MIEPVRPAVEPEEDGAVVVGRDRDRFVVRDGLVACGCERFARSERSEPLWVKRRQVGEDGPNGRPRDVLSQIHPVRADVGDGPKIGRSARLDSPVVILGIEQPVLHVRPGDGEQAAQITAQHALADFAAERIVPHVVIDRRDLAWPRAGQSHELSGFAGGSGERFLANHVAAGFEHGLCLVEVRGVW